MCKKLRCFRSKQRVKIRRDCQKGFSMPPQSLIVWCAVDSRFQSLGFIFFIFESIGCCFDHFHLDKFYKSRYLCFILKQKPSLIEILWISRFQFMRNHERNSKSALWIALIIFLSLFDCDHEMYWFLIVCEMFQNSVKRSVQLKRRLSEVHYWSEECSQFEWWQPKRSYFGNRFQSIFQM
jgi:hypothetical protein